MILFRESDYSSWFNRRIKIVSCHEIFYRGTLLDNIDEFTIGTLVNIFKSETGWILYKPKKPDYFEE